MNNDDTTFTIDISKPVDSYVTTVTGVSGTTVGGITTMPTYTTGGSFSNSYPVTLDSLQMNDTGTEFVYNMPDYDPIPFVTTMPDLDRIDEMCKEYPALAKVYEQFKLIYKMTEQDFKGKLKERGIS